MGSESQDLLAVLEARGFLHQCTDREGLAKRLQAETVSAYIGYDATADSLHAGSLVTIMALRWLQKAGHRPIILMGGGTSKIGDPSGKDESRRMLSGEAIDANIASLSRIFSRFLDFESDAPNCGVFRNNADWLDKLEYVAFLREVGIHFTINRMLRFDSVRLRLDREQPLTFLEFNYMVLQAWDFVQLAEAEGCCLQLGGSDQWGNIVCGIELARRRGGAGLFGLTSPLVTTSSGAKMGKTARGAVWLNAERLSPWEYWQYWRNVEDADLKRFLLLFTELPIDEVARLAALEGQESNEAKRVLANEATRLCHGREAAEQADATAEATFGRGEAGTGLPSVSLSRAEAEAGVAVAELIVRLGFAASRSEARRAILGGAVRLDETRITDGLAQLGLQHLGNEGQVRLSVGRKRHGVVRITD